MRFSGTSAASIEAVGEVSAVGYGRVVFRSRWLSEKGQGSPLMKVDEECSPVLNGSGKPVFLVPLCSWSGKSCTALFMVIDVC